MTACRPVGDAPASGGRLAVTEQGDQIGAAKRSPLGALLSILQCAGQPCATETASPHRVNQRWRGSETPIEVDQPGCGSR